MLLRINFFLRNSESATPDKRLKIYAILELNGYERDTPFSTGLEIPKKYWKGESADQEYIWAEEINQDLQEIRLKLKASLQILKEEEQEITYSSIREIFNTKNKKLKLKAAPPFMDVYDLMVSEKTKKRDLAEGTVHNYNTVRKNLVDLFNSLNLDNPKIDRLNLDLIDKFLDLYRGKWCEDHINKHCWAIRRTFEYAIKKGLMKPIPIWDLELKGSDPKAPNYITPQKREEIKAVNLPSLQETKRIAIFLWSTGFSYIDYLSLEPHDLVTTKNGLCFKKQRGKTKNFSLPPLLPEAAEVLEYYGGISGLPRPHISDFNFRLRILGELVGISKEEVGWQLSSSACRDTYSSMMENEYMVDSRVVMVMMGWTNPRQMRAYSTVQPERVMHEVVMKGINFNMLKLTS